MAVNWGSALQGALGGATSGGTLGSLAGPWGTAIGAGLGALTGFTGGLLSPGTEGGLKQAQILNPQQQSAQQFLLQQGQQQLQNPYQGFQPIAQNAMNRFNQQIVPSLAERFSSLGNNANSSPAFASQIGQAGSGLAELLAAMEAQYGQQERSQGLQTLALGLSPSFENYYQKSQPGFGENLLTGSMQAAPKFYQSYMLGKALDKLSTTKT